MNYYHPSPPQTVITFSAMRESPKLSSITKKLIPLNCILPMMFLKKATYYFLLNLLKGDVFFLCHDLCRGDFVLQNVTPRLKPSV